MKKLVIWVLAILMVGTLVGCAGQNASTQTPATDSGTETATVSDADGSTAVSTGSALDTDGIFTDRDLEQTADLSGATAITVQSGEDVAITEAGVYVLSGEAEAVTVTVEAGDEDKVQLVLDGLRITNASAPCIYVKSADKVFVTTAEASENTLAVTGSFQADGDTNTDAVIFSKDDLVLNGLGTLTVSSSSNGISGKDDVRITGGTVSITCVSDAVEANDSIAICGGTLSINSKKDGLHAENDEDDSTGWIYISGGSVRLSAVKNGIHADTIAQIDGGTLDLTAAEGIEATWVQINDGTITIAANDDGINAGQKSDVYSVRIEINGGSLAITMAAGDTDGIDSNGDLIITGGTIDVTGQNAFDYDGTCTYTGGTLIVNGEQVDSVTNQFGGMGGMGEGFGGMGGMGGHG